LKAGYQWGAQILNRALGETKTSSLRAFGGRQKGGGGRVKQELLDA